MKEVACSVCLGLHFLLLDPHNQATNITPKSFCTKMINISPFYHQRKQVNVREFHNSHHVCEGEI